jgi:hypothetical protein
VPLETDGSKNEMEEEGGRKTGYSVGSRKREWKPTMPTMWLLAAVCSQLSLPVIQATTTRPICRRSVCILEQIKVGPFIVCFQFPKQLS